MAWLEKCHCGKRHRMVLGNCPHCGSYSVRPVSRQVAERCGDDRLCGICRAAADSLKQRL